MIEKLLSGAIRKIDAALDFPGAVSDEDRWKLLLARDEIQIVINDFRAERDRAKGIIEKKHMEGDPKF